MKEHRHSIMEQHISPAVSSVPLSLATFFSVRQASNAVISPDGQHVAFILGEWLPEQDRLRNRLWYQHVATGTQYPLTHGLRDDYAPTWSPDSKSIVFTSRVDQEGRATQPQLYLFSLEGNEIQQICTMSNVLRALGWSPDGTRVAFLASDGDASANDPLILPGEHERSTRLWSIDLRSDVPIPVTPPGLSIWSYSWSPDSTRFAVYYATGPDDTDWYRGQIALVSSQGGALHTISTLQRQAHALTWSPDGTRLAYISGEWSDPDRGGGDIFVQHLADNTVRNLTPEIDWSPTWCQWLEDGERLLCAGWDGLGTRIALVNEQTGECTTLDKSQHPIGDRGWPHLSLSADLRSAVTTRSQQHPYDVWLCTFNDGETTPEISWKRLTRLNPIAEETIKLTQTEHIHYKSIDGWQIEAIITRPERHDFTTPPPLIVNIHGGPSGIWLDDWDYYRSQMLAAAGYVVLRPNIRGSMGRGTAFADAVIGDMGGNDFQDVLAGIDYLVEQKLIDGERVGIMGWSYGGFMTAWSVTHTQRIKAAIMGAGISDFHGFHAQSNIQDWDMRFLGQINDPISPLTHAATYRERSPITYARNCTTPTLIVHGEKDACVPVGQAYAFYRALREQHIPAELVVYPRAGHGLTERAHMLDYQQRVLNWFNQYLKHEPPADTTANG